MAQQHWGGAGGALRAVADAETSVSISSSQLIRKRHVYAHLLPKTDKTIRTENLSILERIGKRA